LASILPQEVDDMQFLLVVESFLIFQPGWKLKN
jgi:hypothetical protein